MIDVIKSCVNQFSNNLQFNYVNPNDISQLHQYFPSAHIIFGEPLTFIPFINQSFTTNLKWFQSTYAGVDAIVKKSKNNNYIVTRAPVFGQHMSEYCLGHIISHERHFPLLREAQLNKQWLTCSYRLLSSLRVGIMGASGEIGQSLARTCKHFGMYVKGLANSQQNTNEFVDKWYQSIPTTATFGIPREFLINLDYLISTLPSTSQTKNMLSGDVLSVCNGSNTVFINIGRGDIIDEQSLVNALNNNYITHAILDVFIDEPLPVTSRLYDLGTHKIQITPHISASSSVASYDIAQIFIRNLKRYINGESLLFVVDWKKGY
ncbi:unnamed protein product [Didymodactylos carnosus]|uniref:D-isomer specific 2-hydroxyacid dehydrogenase NAD-binding domain-containing protein n=1 Tax=Didymodactylos carnosus TaxID=1234261 RepID=A0A814T1U9_9BILA|nr:unnamed protein product [Didymodactylos carnosus]CAF3918891.1 unnamed protein product [Didymodactylos carnosus]